MKHLSVLLLLAVFGSLRVSGQEVYPYWEYRINAGYSIGGTSPLPMPEEVRKVESYHPSIVSPHVAIEATRWLSRVWGISVQFTLDYKGFTVKDRVKDLHTEIEMGDEIYVGHFTGKNKTEISNSYASIPVLASYRLSDEWVIQFGCYVAYLYNSGFKGRASDGYIRQGSPVGEKTIVDFATFDFSDEQKKFDFGLQAAGEWRFSRNFALKGQITWGLTPIFPSDFYGMSFSMYNIYGVVGLSYRLK